MRIVDTRDFGPQGFKWLTLKRITWEDPHGMTRVWETAERTTRRGEVDGVAILAQIVSAARPTHTIVVSQFRPPIGRCCLELPAGLVDAGESPAEAAVRELKEETGYTARRVVEVSVPCCSDPGMTNANLKYVVVEVDGDAPENQGAKQALDDGEFLEVHVTPQHALLDFLLATSAARGWDIDARLLSYAWALSHACSKSTGTGLTAAGVAAQLELQKHSQEEQAPTDHTRRQAAQPSSSSSPSAPGTRGCTSGWYAELCQKASQLAHSAVQAADARFLAGLTVGASLVGLAALARH